MAKNKNIFQIPTTDFTFKKIFGTEANKRFLIDFAVLFREPARFRTAGVQKIRRMLPSAVPQRPRKSNPHDKSGNILHKIA